MYSPLKSAIEATDNFDVISSVGNNEMKAIVLASMQTGVPYSTYPLHSRAMSLQGESPVWKLGVATPFDYCSTFANIGLVAEETVGANAVKAYRISEKGKARAIPLIGHLLDLSLSEEPPLLGYFGPTNTRSAQGVRPSQRRIDVMRIAAGAETEPVRISDIARQLSIKPDHASSIAEDLESFGIISRESRGRGQHSVEYMPADRLMEFRTSNPISQLTLDMIEVLQAHFKHNPTEPITNIRIAQALIKDGKTDMQTKELTRLVSTKTFAMAHKNNVLISRRSIDVGTAREIIWADPTQSKLLNKVLSIIEKFTDNDEGFIAEGNALTNVISEDSELVRYLVSKAQKASIALKGGEAERKRIGNSIFVILSTSASPLSRRQIREALAQESDNLDQNTIQLHLNELMEEGLARYQDTKAGFMYSLIDEL
jgi:predicted ArsR family transcriptional regulator/uncharacterized protein YejL (UPF0352 family)